MKTIVYYTCSFVPKELIAACGGLPQRLVPACDDSRLSRTEGMCSFTKAWLEALLSRPEQEDFVAIFTTSCDQMRRAYDLYGQQSGRRAFLLNIPATTTPQSLDYYRQELERLQAFLGALSGERFNERQLKKLMLGLDPQIQKPKKKGSLKIAFVGGPVPVSIRDAVTAMLHTSNADIFFDAAEDRVMDQCLTFSPTRTQQNPFKELAARYFLLPAIRKRPNDPYYDWFSKKIREKEIDGIVLFRPVFCDLWHSQVYEFKHRFAVPVLDIDLDGKAALSASAVSRIQAFLETLAI